MSTPTQPTLEQLGVTVHKSVVGNPATGYVTWEESKEFVLGQALPSPATVQRSTSSPLVAWARKS